MRIVCRSGRNGSTLPSLGLACVLLVGPMVCCAQISSGSGTAAQIGSQSVPSSVGGRVVNATTGQPVPRALVRLNNRAVLTDSEGKFKFEQNSESSANVLVTKPGFYASAEYGEAGNLYLQAAQLGESLELRLYPEALLTGVVLAPDGTPLPGITVNALRSVYDDSGHRWAQTAQTQTDSHGGFRLPVPAGDYRVQTNYLPLDRTTGKAVLPVVVPNGSSNGTSQLVRIHSGEEQSFELRPSVSVVHSVGIAHSSSDRGFMRISARSSNGSTWHINSMRSSDGETKVQLPQGTYTLTVRTMANAEAAELAETTVTVPDHDISGVVLQFSPVPTIPVELLVDGSSTSDSSPPGLSQFGLSLQSEQADVDGGNAAVGLLSRSNQSYYFLAPPGTYRLAGRSGGSWYIKSASYGDSDLLAQELAVAPGASGTPIRITVSNQTGGLQGSVKLNGDPSACWVYLIPSGPSAQAVYSTRSNSTGGYSFSSLPPGSYQAIAFERRHSADYRDSNSLTPFSDRQHSVSVNAGDKPSLNLDAVPVTEVVP
ncbi:collagen binding domain-containing protein [Granulicella sp. S190]|uniref:MSCRAMM family protein n=1 Tax=Granulicella sp. S190 TaxID=1747226 RepID=UPI00352AC6A8